jgi:pimeloyl-ACP methyl ester carboxylesterase
MKNHLSIIIICLLFTVHCVAQSDCKTTINYGSNSKAGTFAKVNGINMYYEIYGNSNKPSLLLIHGNGEDIYSWRCQIEHFKRNHRVIIVDSRAHGKTENGDKELTYDLMAEDLYSLVNHLNLKSTSILGQSDGAIIGLLLVIKYHDKFEKLIAMGPSLRADTTAVDNWLVDLTKNDLAKMVKQIGDGNNSPELLRKQMQYQLIAKYPNITTSALKKIAIPVLIMSGDDDLIRPEHILEIYRTIPKANLAVLPGATHFALGEEPEMFNDMVDRFLNNQFKRPTSRAVLESFR